MATVEQVQSISALADADLSANQFYFVKLTGTTYPVALCNAQGDVNVFGVLMNKPGEATGAAGEVAEVAYAGAPKVVAGAVIARGAKVTPQASGKAETAATGDAVAGVALEAAAADGDIIRIALVSKHLLA